MPKFWTENQRVLTEAMEKCYSCVIDEYGPFYGGHLLRGLGRRMELVFNSEYLVRSARLFHSKDVKHVWQFLNRKYQSMNNLYFELSGHITSLN